MTFFIPGPKGRLEAELWMPEDEAEPRAACVMCHPNPAGGGTMRTTALFRAARGLQKAGLAVLRFNYRGVEGSDGEIEAGPHEVDDLNAALDHLQERFSNAELWAGGFSFGARTAAAHVLRDDRVKRVVLIALPVTAFDCAVIEEVKTPGYLIQAGNDQFGNLSDLKRLYPNVSGELELDEIPGVEHFFQGQTRELEERVCQYAKRVHA